MDIPECVDQQVVSELIDKRCPLSPTKPSQRIDASAPPRAAPNHRQAHDLADENSRRVELGVVGVAGAAESEVEQCGQGGTGHGQRSFARNRFSGPALCACCGAPPGRVRAGGSSVTAVLRAVPVVGETTWSFLNRAAAAYGMEAAGAEVLLDAVAQEQLAGWCGVPAGHLARPRRPSSTNSSPWPAPCRRGGRGSPTAPGTPCPPCYPHCPATTAGSAVSAGQQSGVPQRKSMGRRGGLDF